MKRFIALALILVSLAFALPTIQGTRGTNFVSSALCEDMGFLWFYIAPEGYSETVLFLGPAGDTINRYDILAGLPTVSIGFTPWHYLEFSVYGNGYFYMNQTPSATAYGLSDVGGHVKGSIPLTPIDDEERPMRMALGIDGFFLMTLPFELDAAANAAMEQYLGYYPFEQKGPEFGGKLLFTAESRYITGHVNAGYWYRSAHQFGTLTLQYPQTILGGIGVESSPWPWLNLFLDFNLDYGLDMMNPDTLTGIATHASGGVRFPLMMGKNKGFGLLFSVGGGVDPMNFQETSSLYAGIGIGGDLIQPKELFLEGIVVNEETGEPIEGAAVVIDGPDRDTTIRLTTDSLGRFSVNEDQILDSDSLYVTAENFEPEARTPAELEVLLAALESKETIELELELSPVVIEESFIAGVVSDAETMEPVSAVIRFDEFETGEILAPVSSDPVTGYFRVRIEPGQYNMRTTAEGYNDDRRSIDINPEQDTIVDIYLNPVEAPEPPPELEPLVVSGFGKGGTVLSLSQMKALEEVVDLMKAEPDVTVVIIGHTDSVGPDAINIRVGMARARAAADYIIMRGIDARRIDTMSAGERWPIGDNRYRSGRAMNRRFEIQFHRGETVASDGGDSNYGASTGSGSGTRVPPTVK